jgi:hypothetical protein
LARREPWGTFEIGIAAKLRRAVALIKKLNALKETKANSNSFNDSVWF